MQVRGIGSFAAVIAGMALLAGPAGTQLPSNASVQGAYYFRYLGVNAVPSDAPLAFQGTIVFDGKADSPGNPGYGTFTVTGQGTTGAALGPQANNIYKVLSNGLIDFTNPLDATNQTTLFGGVGSGALALSSTDSNYCDLFVGVPVSTSNSAANLNGKYYLAGLEFLNGSFGLTRNTFFTATFDGKGSLGNVTINGAAANLGSTPQSQTSTAATYTIAANGAGTLNFPAPTGLAAASVLLSGNKAMYVSPDGSFFVAGGGSSYDFAVGVKALTGSPAGVTNGLYFTASLGEAVTSSTVSIAYGEDGSLIELSPLGIEIAHQRVNPDYGPSYDATYADAFQPAADGTVTQSGAQYAAGAGGNIVIGSGKGTSYRLAFYVKSPPLSAPAGAAVFLNPQQVYNAASSVPFTASVAPGEFITLGGTGMASQTAQASSLPFPVLLGGAQVNISWIDVNGLPQSAQAPLSYVSPTQINALAPYSVPAGSLIAFQVTNNGAPSNSVRVYSGLSSPGVFTIPPGGIGNGAIQHADYSLVSTASPAKVGETVLIYLTGLGLVTATPTAGAAASANPLSQAPIPSVRIGGQIATVLFSGLTPGAAGLYQLNVTIPPGVTAGSNATIEIATLDSAGNLVSDNLEATIPISK